MFEMSVGTFREMSEDNGGFCLACKEEAWGVEPDARNYECECCGENQVFGLEEILMMGLVTLID